MITLVPPMDPSNEWAVAVTTALPEGVLEDAEHFLLHKTLFIGFIHITTSPAIPGPHLPPPKIQCLGCRPACTLHIHYLNYLAVDVYDREKTLR